MQTRTRTFKVLPSERAIITDILSQAITGELISMSNFVSLADMTGDVEQKMRAVDQAYLQRSHVEGMMNLAEQFDLRPAGNIEGQYWRAFRCSFLRYVLKNDYWACLIIQGIMQKSFAVSMYDDVGVELDNAIGEFFCMLAEEEREYINRTVDLLKPEWKKNPEAFGSKMEQIHWDCMTVLARWSAKADLCGHCGICVGVCMKESLQLVNTSITSLRGNALKVYAGSLERLGIPTHKTLPWIAGLPV